MSACTSCVWEIFGKSIESFTVPILQRNFYSRYNHQQPLLQSLNWNEPETNVVNCINAKENSSKKICVSTERFEDFNWKLRNNDMELLQSRQSLGFLSCWILRNTNDNEIPNLFHWFVRVFNSTYLRIKAYVEVKISSTHPLIKTYLGFKTTLCHFSIIISYVFQILHLLHYHCRDYEIFNISTGLLKLCTSAFQSTFRFFKRALLHKVLSSFI